MTTSKRLFVAGAFWLATKALRIPPPALIGAVTSRTTTPEAHESDKETSRCTERSGELWPRGHVHRVRRRGHITQKTSPVRRGERR